MGGSPVEKFGGAAAMPLSMRSILCVLGYAQAVLGFKSYVADLSSPAGTPASCSNTQVSCRNTTAVPEACCFNHPGGQLLLTQFWDIHPPTGPGRCPRDG